MSQFIEMFGNPVTNTKGWKTAKIKDVAPEMPSKEQLSGKIWLLNLDMIESNTGRIIEKVYEDVENALSVQSFDEGNVLFSKLRPYLNKVVIPDEPGMATTELVPLRPEPSKLHKVFLSHLLRGNQFVNYANDIAGGTKMPRMPLTELRNFDCILPPMDKQLEFVFIAEQVDKSEFVGCKSQFIEMFGNPVTNTKGWKTAKIKDVAPEMPSKEQLSGKIWLLNLDMIESNTGRIIEKVYEDVENALSVQSFDEGNVLFSKLRPYLNKVVIPDEPGMATTELVPLRPEPSKLHKVFLSHLLRGNQFVNYANDIAGGTKMPRMPLTELRNFDCILPPMDKQLEFVFIAEQVDKSEYYN